MNKFLKAKFNYYVNCIKLNNIVQLLGVNFQLIHSLLPSRVKIKKKKKQK